MSTRVTRSRKADKTHQTSSAPNTSAPAEATSTVTQNTKPEGGHRLLKNAEVPEGKVTSVDKPGKRTKQKTSKSHRATISRKRVHSPEPARDNTKRAKVNAASAARCSTDDQPTGQSGRRYMLPDLSNVEDSMPNVVESRDCVEGTKRTQKPVKHTKPQVSKPTSEHGGLAPVSAVSDDEISSSASGSESDSSGEDEIVGDSDLEILERNPDELERQLSAERPKWTSESSEPVAIEERSMEQMGKDKVSRKTKTHKQPNVEHPVWKDLPETQTAPLLKVPALKMELDIGDNKDGLRAPSANAYQLVFPEKSGPLNLLAQHSHIQAAARQSFIRVERELVTTHAFPNTLLRRCFVRDALAASARELGHEALEAQILDNEQFARTLGSIPNQRISTFRSELKDLAQNSTAAHYGLLPGQCAPKVEWLLGELIYIYPNLDFERNSGSWEKPYGHPLVVHILQQAFFGGPESVGCRFPEIFTSSLPDKSEERELPMAMVALVGTAIHAGLLQWQTGQYTKIDFSGNTFIDKYREHITFMTHTQTQNARGYHTAMHNLYKTASGFDHAASASSSAHAVSAISRLAIHLMEVS